MHAVFYDVNEYFKYFNENIIRRVPTSVPFSCLYMREEFFIYPKFALENKYTNITKYTIAPSGGHFGAFEMPKLVAENAISHFENY